jgi:hypothetical protein
MTPNNKAEKNHQEKDCWHFSWTDKIGLGGFGWPDDTYKKNTLMIKSI